MKSEPKWRSFEKLVAEVQRELAPSAVVTHDDHIKGYDSETLRQIDITVKQKIGQYDMLIAIDCKDYQHPVDVKDIEEFTGLIKDIRANKGVIVAANGFTETAKRIGEKLGINLYRLIDTEAHNWRTYVSIPIICDFRRIKFQFILPQILALTDPRKIEIYDFNNQRIGTTESLILTRWNSGELPIDLGEHKNIPLSKEPIKMFHNNDFVDVNILANIMVSCRLFFGELPLEQIRGFADEYRGQLITNGFTTGWLGCAEVERSWRQLVNINEIAVKPVFILTALDIADIPQAS